MNLSLIQAAECERWGAEVVRCLNGSKAGVALETLGRIPLNGLRHQPEAGDCGWYIWGGEELSQSPDFFSPLHVEHLGDYVPELVPYLSLPPGWRVLVAPGQIDVWFDLNLLSNPLDGTASDIER